MCKSSYAPVSVPSVVPTQPTYSVEGRTERLQRDARRLDSPAFEPLILGFPTIGDVFDYYLAYFLCSVIRAAWTDRVPTVQRAADDWNRGAAVSVAFGENLTETPRVIIRWPDGIIVTYSGQRVFAVGALMIFMGAVGTAATFGLGQVNAEFLARADAEWAALQPLLADLELPILFAGHSAGGAMATLLAQRVHHTWPTRLRGAFVFGSPRVGNSTWAEEYEPNVLRLENDRDPVTIMPPHIGFGLRLAPVRWAVSFLSDFQHVGTTYTLTSDLQLIPSSWSDGGIFRPAQEAAYLATAAGEAPLAFAGGGMFAQHKIQEYCTRVQRKIDSFGLRDSVLHMRNYPDLVLLNQELASEGF
jgi:hypothetical protein